jgi:S-DNA-T family DNA segregation ATPase FtsK/SpoIIIE
VISLRCTLLDAARPDRSFDIDVDAPSGSTLQDLAEVLSQEGHLASGRHLTVAGAAVPRDSRLGHPPLVSGALLVATTTDEAGSRTSRGVLELQVVGGPDCGGVVPLRPGRVTVGRCTSADVAVEDPALSRQHLRITVASDGLLLEDLRSSNGTTVDGQDVGPQGVRVVAGQRISAGSSKMVVRASATRPAWTARTPDGGLAVSPGPRSAPVPATTTIDRPAPPTPREPAKLPWIAMLLPALVCVPLAWLAGQPSYLVLGLLSPLSIAGSALTDRLTRKRETGRERSAWKASDEEAAHRIAQALSTELRLRRDLAGDPAELATTARVPGHRIWERAPHDDDVVDLVGGHGPQSSSVVVTTADGPQVPVLSDAPVVVRLSDVGHLGLSGDARAVQGAARLLVGALCVRATPRAVQLVVVGGPTWAWTRWLPHHRSMSLGALSQEVAARTDAADGRGAGGRPRVVALVEEVHHLASDPSLATVLDDGPAVGVHLICLAPDHAGLPSGCAATLAVDGRGGGELRLPQREPTPVAVDAVSTDWAEVVARALAPLRDATPDGASLPARVTLHDVSPVDPVSASDIAARWARAPRSTSAFVGATTHGPLGLDLVRDGPHALVAGTTGSGKSELLQTLVTSLALGNRPDELTFVLVDYKGGAAFRELAGLPHVVGLVTDLDHHLAQRALTSLQAELTRRERLLADASASDITEYQAAVDAGTAERLSRLVLVVDEFRLLAGELPEFLDGLVRLAAVGRSLGVHLVLATQRPGGVVTADIKANVNLRISLRVRDRADSDDVLEAPDAASLPQDVPGRALYRSGSQPLTPFQVALAASPTLGLEPGRVSVRPVAASVNDARTAVGAGLQPCLQALREATAHVGAAPPASPWLPPLPDVVDATELSGDRSTHPDDGVPLALADLPALGARRPLTWHPLRSSHLAVSGTSRTGRTTTLLALALALAEALSPEDLHLHVVAADDTLAGHLNGLPHLGTTVTVAEPRRVHRLVTRLAGRTDAAQSAASTVLLVDGWEPVAEGLDHVEHGRATDELLALLRDGEARGVRAVVAGGRGVLTSRLASLAGERLLLRSADPSDLLLGGASTTTPLRHQPPGRAIHVPSGHEAQVAWPGDGDQVRQQVGAIRRRWTSDAASAGPAPVRLVPLPTRAVLASSAGRPAGGGMTVRIGPGGDTGEEAVLDLGSHPLVAVCGPPGSGRSTALAAIAGQLHAAGVPVLSCAPAGSPLGRGPWPVATAHDLLDTSAWPTADAPCVLVDDIDLLPDLDLESLAHARAVIVATTTEHLAGSYRGVGAAVRRHRTGLLLRASRPSDGEPFGIRAERPDCAVPGRGLLVVRGVATPVQVAVAAS